MQKGNIGVTTENIFPVIKKFLYSDQEIFLREIVSNAVDATQKLKTLQEKGEFKGEIGDITVHVNLDIDKGTITISDHGIGMTEEEIDTMRILNTLGWFREMYDATKKFHAVITGSDTAELIRWMKRFWKTSIATLKTFIIGIMKDFKAVRNTIRLNVTNGITEGYVNKLKAVKRLMYGRAGIELLKNKLVLEHVLFN